MVKILIVDDSKFMRVNLERLLSADPLIQVVGTARNGIDAIEILKQQPVDVVICDFFMPKMDGIETLEHIMKNYQIPTIMITIADKSENADLYFKALRLGAFDIIPKPTGLDSLYVDQMETELREKIHIAAKSRKKLKVFAKVIDHGKDTPESLTKKEQVSRTYVPYFNVVIIGASTGGPSMVFEIIKNLKYHSNICVIVVQHMPAGFTQQFAKRLDATTEYKFYEPINGEPLRPGTGIVAPGNFHLRLKVENNDVYIVTDQSERVWGVRPCIDYTMGTAAPIFKNKLYGVIMTGMGKDGAKGISEVKKYNGTTFAQIPDEALISSMPEKAIATGDVEMILPLQGIVRKLNELIR